MSRAPASVRRPHGVVGTLASSPRGSTSRGSGRRHAVVAFGYTVYQFFVDFPGAHLLRSRASAFTLGGTTRTAGRTCARRGGPAATVIVLAALIGLLTQGAQAQVTVNQCTELAETGISRMNKLLCAFVLLMLVVVYVLLRPSGHSAPAACSPPAAHRLAATVGCQTEPCVRDVGSQSMVTYKRKWLKPEFRCLPDHSHG